MSIELCVLGSGSSGNCSALRTPAGTVLIDAGLGSRVTEGRLKSAGCELDAVRAICLTHLDRDHFNPSWINTISRRGIHVFVHSQRLNDLLRTGLGDDSRRENQRTFKSLVRTFGTTTPFSPIDGMTARAIKLAHDSTGSHAFVFDGFGVRVGWATDLGHVPDELVQSFQNIDVLAMEANYDREMQEQSARPWYLKHRIMGGSGHLSNEQAFAAVRAILDRCQRDSARMPSHIVLLHRSRQCNCPHLLRRLFRQDPRVAGRLTLTDQHRPTNWLRPHKLQPNTGEQFMLEWSANS